MKILIIGSGVGGLCLAQGLLKSKILFHIYERDTSNDYRAQGYRIRIHGAGVDSLRSVLTDEILKLFEQTCAATKLGPIPSINAITGENQPSAPFGPGGAGPGSNHRAPNIAAGNLHTVDRTVLRQVLLTGLKDHISYGKEFTHYVLDPSGTTAHFKDGTSVSGSLLVGADGWRSRVRKQYLPSHKVLDTRGRIIYGKTPLTSDFEARFSDAAMVRMCGLKDPDHGTMTLVEAIRFAAADVRSREVKVPADYVYWVMCLSGSSPPVPDEELTSLGNAGAAALSRRLTEHWHGSLRPLTDMQDESQTSVLRLVSSPAEVEAWEADARITLIGDAVHVMLPTAASGANTVMRDAALLTKVLGEKGVSRESIAEYEAEMRRYAGETIRMSAKVGQMSFGQRVLEECEPVDV